MQAAIFQDQLLYMKTQQFALDMSGLTQLRDQFQRCWQFVKQHAAASRRPPSNAPAPPAPGTAQKPDQFSAAATKNAIRVEDLKPPPPKHRRTGSALGTSPANTGSPYTPAANTTSPAPNTGSPATASGNKAKAPPKPRSAPKKESGGLTGSSPVAAGNGNGASPAATLAALRTDLIRDSPSPRGIALPAGSGPPVPVEDPPSLKRKREEEEIEKNPDAFIEKTLQSLDPAVFSFDDFLLPGVVDVSAPSSAPGTATGLALDFEPALPPVVVEPTTAPLSFVSSAPGASMPKAHAATAAPDNGPEVLDFDFLIDSSAAGFAEPDAPTPDLVGGGGGEGSTASAQTPATPADNNATVTPKNPPTALTKSPKKQPDASPHGHSTGNGSGDSSGGMDDAFFSTGGLVVEDIDRWLAGGESSTSSGHESQDADRRDAKNGMPEFSWEGEASSDAWSFYPDF